MPRAGDVWTVSSSGRDPWGVIREIRGRAGEKAHKKTNVGLTDVPAKPLIGI